LDTLVTAIAIAKSSRRRTIRGDVLVELALISLIFFVILIGILDFGQFLFCQQAVVERARSAARWGALTDPTNSQAITNMALYNHAIAPTNGTAPSFGLTAAMVSVSAPDEGTDNYRLVVQISGYSFQSFSPFLARRFTGAPIRVSVPLGLYN
jgi:Flp pilus assembly protein TadG